MYTRPALCTAPSVSRQLSAAKHHPSCVAMGRVSRQPGPLYLRHTAQPAIDNKRAARLALRKLRKLGDAETELCRAVLLNNSLQRLRAGKRDFGFGTTNTSSSSGNSPTTPQASPTPSQGSSISSLTSPASQVEGEAEALLGEISLPPPLLLPQAAQFTIARPDPAHRLAPPPHWSLELPPHWSVSPQEMSYYQPPYSPSDCSKPGQDLCCSAESELQRGYLEDYSHHYFCVNSALSDLQRTQ